MTQFEQVKHAFPKEISLLGEERVKEVFENFSQRYAERRFGNQMKQALREECRLLEPNSLEKAFGVQKYDEHLNALELYLENNPKIQLKESLKRVLLEKALILDLKSVLTLTLKYVPTSWS